MPDREKVITALAICTGKCKCVGCWYGQNNPDFRCQDRLKEDALALLREQEPRVLTHDETIVLPEGTPVWFEESNDTGQTFLSPMICHGNGLYGNRFMLVDAKQLYWRGRRFWTAKPDVEQRKAVKWNEPYAVE